MAGHKDNSLTLEEWGQITEIFQRALQKPLEARTEFVNRECAVNADCRRLILSLLFHHQEHVEAYEEDRQEIVRPLTKNDLANGRFLLQEELGSGSFGVVYRALDRMHNVFVAIKVLRQVDSHYLYRFKREFRKSTVLDHLNIVRPHELFNDGQFWFFSMQLVDGIPMVSHIRGKADSPGSLSEEGLRRAVLVFRQLVNALRVLHEQGLVHGDIKPTNVLVTEEGTVKVLDFSLVREIDPGASFSDSFGAGTPHYMSPEQVRQRGTTDKSDWYSVGVVLYEALTGALPFHGSLYQILFEKCNQEPSFPEGNFGPKAIVQLCLRLLRRDPQERPNAGDIQAIFSGLDAESKDGGTATFPATGLFVGREREMDVLGSAFDEVSSNSPVRVDVVGHSGIGKTALVRSFLLRIRKRRPNVTIATGRCGFQESVPFKALDEVIDTTARYLNTLSATAREGVLPRHLPDLARLFPVMQQFVALGTARRDGSELIEPQELRMRAIAALKELLSRLSERAPLIIWIDDVQWGDVDSAQIVEQLLKPPDCPGLLVVLSYRQEDKETSLFLKKLSADGGDAARLLRVAVGPLEQSGAKKLARAVAAAMSDSDAERIVAEADGNPLFIQELAQFRVSRPRSLHSLYDAIQQRVGVLPAAIQRLAEVLAVAGQPLALHVANEVAAVSSSEFAVLSSSSVQTLIRPCGTFREDLDLYHDKVREAVLAMLPAERVKEYHGQLASALQREPDTEPDRLLRHFTEAEDFAAAFLYAVDAAKIATQCLAFESAAHLLQAARRLRQRIASLGLPAPNGPEDRILCCGIAEAFANAGQALRAAAAYLEGAGLAEYGQAADLRLRAADQLLRGGKVDEGVKLLRAALRELGVWIPRGRIAILAAVLLTRIRIRFRSLTFEGRPAGQIPDHVLERVDRLWTSGMTLTATDPLIATYIRGQHYLLAMRVGEPYRISLAFDLEAVTRSMPHSADRLRSRELLESAQSISERLENPHARAMADVGAAGAAFFSGSLREAVQYATRAEEALRQECRGVSWELATVRVLLLGSMSLMGRYTEYASKLTQTLKEAEMNGDLYSRFALPLSSGVYTLRLSADEPERSQRELDENLRAWGRTEFDIPHFSHWYGSVETQLYQRNLEQAWRLIESSWPALRRGFILQLQFQALLACHIRARTAIALYASGDRQERWMREATRFVIYSKRSRLDISRGFHAAIRAALAAFDGKQKAAASLLEEAEEVFENLGWVNYAMALSFRRGALLGGARGRTLQEIAREKSQSIGVKNLTQFCEMLVAFPASS